MKTALLSATYLFETGPYQTYKVIFQPLMQGGPTYTIRDPSREGFSPDDHLHTGPMPASQDAETALRLLSDYLQDS